jgi:hypothetical protein
LLLLGLSLSFLWTSGYSDDKIIGGLIPLRDAFDYYNGANWLLSGQAIKILDEGAAWRPLYPGFLSALLWITGRNLQWALVIQVGLAGLCLALSACYVRTRLGAAAAALYVTLLYFYIQPLIGTAYTETLGLALGCLGFVLLWESAETRRTLYLIEGLFVLMLAVSARAGAFFVFPALAVWAGWAWRGVGRFSFRYAALALATALACYLIVNTLYDKLTVEPGGFPFGNFAFTLYGQVSGGAGYHKAFEDLGVRNPALILRAAERFFLAHPASFAVGAAKAYRDFFSPGSGVFSLGSNPADMLVWILGIPLSLFGLYRLIRPAAASASALFLAGFIGILLSIPFLPPIDGGIRIYASTMPFVYALPAVGLAGLTSKEQAPAAPASTPAYVGILAVALSLITLVVPVLIRFNSPVPGHLMAGCETGKVAYEVVVDRGSYIDLVPDGTAACGNLPEVCLGDFQRYTKLNDPSDAQVFDELTSRAAGSTIRVFAANDFYGGRPHLFVVDSERLGLPSNASPLRLPANAVIGGCATETLVKGRPSIFDIQNAGDVILMPVR